MRRLFVGQGSLHILTAIVAGETCSAGGPVPGAGDVLLFHGLNPERDQSDLWARVLARAARELGDWDRVVFLAPERIDAWTAAAARQGWRAVAPELRAEIGAIDEIYIQRNPDFINRLIVAACPGARTVCTGDGLGLNYSEEYWTPAPPRAARPPALAAWPRRAARLGRRLGARLLAPRPPEAAPPAPRFDRHCLLLPNCFDDRVEDPAVPDPERLRRRIDALVPLLAAEGGREGADRLARAIRGASEIVVLLPSCFAEAGRVEPEAEIDAYLEVIDELAPSPGAAIVLKPHPRDRRAKTERLMARLAERGPVHLLDDPWSRYLPFEVTLRLALSAPDLPPRRFVTFSSACLALELLFGERTELGFGEARVRRHFRPEYVERRLVHERDLRNAIERVRSAATSRGAGARPG